ncbi:hypothetical protein TBR22_A31880 [Luteitalea sp. TBR-22]|uniref:hypothetical protein n=1 Tax=Luteitalea sp. TBR-22 TaxID=2802971 RepID=UPI001AF587AF|nr:hypothetical protein [Luteitalea sp. TBR-22]BCS33960.1 hypothetical protein TBR22_A31880 [Luteitalea sp. TBR-22]
MPRRLASVLTLALSAAPLVAAAQAPSTFTVAVVRDDGIVLPVATHDRGRWRTPWPGPAKEAEVPVRLEDCPLAWWGLPSAPTAWTLFVPGETPRTFRMDRITWVPWYCQQQVVLHSRAAARPLLRLPDGFRTPKHAVAVTGGDASIELPREVAPGSPEAATLLDALQRPFNQQERLMLAGDFFGRYTPSVSAEARDGMPVTALSIHEGPGRHGDRIYFVEMERRYPRRGPSNLQWCDEVSYMAGWARRGSDGALDLTLVERTVTSCLLDSVVRAVPHVIVHTSRGPTWLLELYRPTFANFGLFLAPEGDAPELLLLRPAGRCEPGQGIPDRVRSSAWRQPE